MNFTGQIKRLAATGSMIMIGALTFGAGSAAAASTPNPVATIAMPTTHFTVPPHVTRPAHSDPIAHIAVGPSVTRSRSRHHVTRPARSHHRSHRASAR